MFEASYTKLQQAIQYTVLMYSTYLWTNFHQIHLGIRSVQVESNILHIYPRAG